MSEFAVIYETADDGSWHAHAADLPVYAVGDTRQEAEREIQSAIAFYLDHLRSKDEPIPQPRSSVGTVRV